MRERERKKIPATVPSYKLLISYPVKLFISYIPLLSSVSSLTLTRNVYFLNKLFRGRDPLWKWLLEQRLQQIKPFQVNWSSVPICQKANNLLLLRITVIIQNYSFFSFPVFLSWFRNLFFVKFPWFFTFSFSSTFSHYRHFNFHLIVLFVDYHIYIFIIFYLY